MAIEVKVPDMGESVIEATIARWLKQEGERVAPGEPVVELETDKINLEVGAQQAGVLERIQKQAGETVNVGDVLAWVAEGDGGGAVSTRPQAQEAPPSASQGAAEKPHTPIVPQSAPLERLPSEAQIQPADQGGTLYQGSTEQQRGEDSQPQPAAGVSTITPVAARMAQDLGIDLSQVQPSAGGRITREDVEAYAARQKGGSSQPAAERPISAEQGSTPYQGSTEQRRGPDTSPTVEPAPPKSPSISPTPSSNGQGSLETRVRLSRRRQTIAKRLVEAQHTAAMLTTFNEIDMSKVMDLRKRRREGFKERFGVDLGFMSFFIKASVAALKAFPNVNAELQNDELVLKQYYDIGIAVGAEEGLVVPVIRGADRLNFAGIEKAVKDLAEKARSGALTLDDLRGGTFTITNGGIYGSLMSTPILNPPQVGILGMHAIKERAVVINGEIVARPMMYVALSYDHRVVDGSEAVRFLVRIKEMIEDPETLLFG